MHPLGNFILTKVVLYYKDLLRYSEEIQIEKLKNQKVIRVERIKRKIDGVLSSTPFGNVF